MTWEIICENDTGPGDEGFWETWIVTDGEHSFETKAAEEAAWLQEFMSKNVSLREHVRILDKLSEAENRYLRAEAALRVALEELVKARLG